jgi:hypothetical protein
LNGLAEAILKQTEERAIRNIARLDQQQGRRRRKGQEGGAVLLSKSRDCDIVRARRESDGDVLRGISSRRYPRAKAVSAANARRWFLRTPIIHRPVKRFEKFPSRESWGAQP